MRSPPTLGEHCKVTLQKGLCIKLSNIKLLIFDDFFFFTKLKVSVLHILILYFIIHGNEDLE